MKTCESHSDVVVIYDNYNCPVCQLENDLLKKEQENNDLSTEIEELKAKLNELEN